MRFSLIYVISYIISTLNHIWIIFGTLICASYRIGIIVNCYTPEWESADNVVLHIQWVELVIVVKHLNSRYYAIKHSFLAFTI